MNHNETNESQIKAPNLVPRYSQTLLSKPLITSYKTDQVESNQCQYKIQNTWTLIIITEKQFLKSSFRKVKTKNK